MSSLDKLRSKLAELKSQNGERRILWKPKQGSQVIRIAPYIYSEDEDIPFVELLFHYNVAKKTIISPLSFGKPDPIFDFSQELQSTGDRDEWKHGKKIEPKRRTYVPILVRGEEDQGVKFWGFGTQIYEELIRKMVDPDWGKLAHPFEGRDITVTFEKATKPNTYPKTIIDVKPNKTPITSDPKVMDALKAMPKVESLWDEPTYEELKAILDAYVATGQPVESTFGARSKEGTANPIVKEAVEAGTIAATPAATGESTKDEIKSAFDSYFKKDK
tara:strand:- start:319 stop:1140 length:822 start_codon:yes stop_codon:yes gene_type:complete